MDNILLSELLTLNPLLWQIPLCALAAALVYLIRIHIAVSMARRRHRSTIGWGLFSFFISPIWAWTFLFILGKYIPPSEEE